MGPATSFLRELALIAIVLSMLTSSSASGPTVQQRNVDSLVETAAEYGLRGDLKGAVVLLGNSATFNVPSRMLPGRSRSIRGLPQLTASALFAYQQSQFDNRVEKSFADANRAIALDPTFPLSFIIRGSARLELKEYTAAVVDFTKAIRLNPRSYSAYGNRARAYSALK